MTPKKTPAGLNATVATVKALTETLKRVGNVVPTRVSLPVLSHVLVEAVPGRGLRISGTDLDVALRAKLNAKVEVGGRVTVPLRPWLKILGTLDKSAMVRLTVEGDSSPRVVMECGKSRTTLMGLPAEEFPIWPTPEGEVKSRVEKATRYAKDDAKAANPPDVRTLETTAPILAELARVTPFASTEESRPILNGVLLEIQPDDSVISVATNGHRMACVGDRSRKEPAMSHQLILPPLAMACAAKFAGETPITLTWLAYGDKAPENRLWVEDRDVEITARLIEGPYPHWRQVWPRDNTQELRVERKPFLATVKRITSLASEITHRIALDFGVAPVTVKVSTTLADVGATEESVDAKWTGQALRVGVNGAYLTPVLAALDSDDVRLTFHENPKAAPERAMTIDGNGADAGLSFLLMPLRLVD